MQMLQCATNNATRCDSQLYVVFHIIIKNKRLIPLGVTTMLSEVNISNCFLVDIASYKTALTIYEGYGGYLMLWSIVPKKRIKHKSDYVAASHNAYILVHL